MFVPFLIMFREGLEAALIVSLIASYLKRTQRGQWLGVVWIGVIVAAALCLALGVFINETTGEFPQKQQELFEGIVAVIAVCILTYMVFWMRKVSRSIKVHLEGAIDNALNSSRGQGWSAGCQGRRYSPRWRPRRPPGRWHPTASHRVCARAGRGCSGRSDG